MGAGGYALVGILWFTRYALHTMQGVYLKRYSKLAYTYTMINDTVNTCAKMMMNYNILLNWKVVGNECVRRRYYILL